MVGIDRFAPPHQRGSSHGESRITRQAIGEGEEYVPFVLRSHEIWRELEGDTGEALLSTVGGLFLSRQNGTALHHGQADFVGRTIAAARRYRIVHEILSPTEVQARFPTFRLVGDEVAYYEPGAGFLRPERCVAVQLERARTRGASIRTGETVVRITSRASDVQVVTDVGTYAAGAAVVTAGAWLPALLGEPFSGFLRIYRQVMHWFEPDDASMFAPGRFPIFIWLHGPREGDHFYGLPLVSEGVKLATEQFAETADPDTVSRNVSDAETAGMYTTHVRDRILGVGPRCLRTEACLYTVAPDSRFLVDQNPDSPRVLVASPCSGHGFKHSAALGEAIAERVITGKSRLDLAPFSLSRVARDTLST